MAYGILKCDNITFDQGGADQNVTVSGIYRAITSGVTVTGTISGVTIIGTTTVSGATVTGTAVQGTTVQGVSGTFTSLTGTTTTGTTANFVSGVFTTRISGATVTGDTGQFTSGTFVSLTGTTITGTTINAVTVSSTTGTFGSITGTTITGTTINGATVNSTTGNFTSLTGVTVTGTTAQFASGVFITQVSGLTVTGTQSSFTSGNFVTLSGATATFTSGVIASGTAAAPSLSILGDLNTGIYSPGADQVAVATNGTEKLIVKSSGEIGIGTSVPNYQLHATTSFAVGAAGFNQQLSFTNDTIQSLILGTGYTPLKLNPLGGNVGIGTTSPATTLQVIGIGAFGNGVGGRVQVTTDSNLGYLDSLDNAGTAWQPLLQRGTAIQFHTNTAGTTPAQKAVITAGGLVGIGTSSPGALLDVREQANAVSQQIRLTNTNTVGTVGSAIKFQGFYDTALISSDGVPGATTGGSLRLQTYSSNGVLNTGINVDRLGNVGIGTTSPSSLLHLGAASGTVQMQFNNGGTSSYIGHDSGFTGLDFAAGGGIKFRYYTGAAFAEAARIDSSGRLLVGTSTSLNGDALFQSAAQTNVAAELFRFSTGAGFDGALFYLTRSKSGSIGTASAVAAGDGLGAIVFNAAGNSSTYVQGAKIFAQVDSGTVSATSMPGRLVFSTTADGASSPTERMRINSSGHLLFQGTDNTINSGFYAVPGETGTTPVKAFALHEAGKIGISYPGQWRFLTSSGNGATTLKEGFYLHIRNYDIGSAAESGDLFQLRGDGGLANFSANNVNLSDRNAKKDISPAADTWNCLKEWEIVNYRYKDQPDDADLNLGVIAQQVAESCPEVITIFQDAKEATEDAPAQEERLGVKEQQMYWMAIKALQEAQVRIEQLESKVAALESA